MLASKLRATVALLAAAALFGVCATGASADVVPLPNGSTGSYYLAGIACPAAGDCVAVGSYTDSTLDAQGLIETESNGAWTASTVDLSSLPPLVDDSNAQLTSVSCTGVGDCVAVGSYDDANGPEGLIETEKNGTWNATKLDLSSLPNVNSLPSVSLASVSCPSLGNCATVGYYVDASGAQQGLLASESNGAWTASEADVSKIGGSSQPATMLVQVSCASAGNCAAVGYYGDNAGNTLGLIATESNRHWGIQGPDFSQLPSVAPWGTQVTMLRSVSCPSAGHCTAVGTYIDGTANGGSTQGMLLTENNGPWSPATEATLPGDAYTTNSGSGAQLDLNLNSVSCASPGNCTAVGSYDATASNNIEALELTETGGAWGSGVAASLPAGAAGNPQASLDSVYCRSPGSCLASGTDEASDGNNAALIARQASGTWSTAGIEQASNYAYFLENTTSVSCAANGYCATAGTAADLLGNTTALLMDAPGAVRSLRAVTSGKKAAALNWGNPGTDSSEPGIGGYTVTVHDVTRASRGGQTIAGTSGRNLKIPGLHSGDRYTFTVSDTSILGTGIPATSGKVALGLTRQQIARSLARLLAPRGPDSRLTHLRRADDYTFTYRPLEAGKVSVRWHETTGHGKHRHSYLVAPGSAVPRGTRAVKVRVRLTSFGRIAVDSASRLRLTATVTFKSGSTKVTRTHSFSLH
jgi:hypothetical protein